MSLFDPDPLKRKGEWDRSRNHTYCRVTTLETQISELEAEASRLLKALDSLKEAKAESERTEKKRAEESAKEIVTQSAEIESLRSKVKQFADYDEIKRELEIMKVNTQ